MIAEAILSTLDSLGVAVETDGEYLVLSPAARVSPELADLIRPRKAELVGILAARQLEARILAVLRSGEVHSTRSLAARLDLAAPDPVAGGPLYAALGALHERGEIATDPKTCTFRAALADLAPTNHPERGEPHDRHPCRNVERPSREGTRALHELPPRPQG